MSASVSGWKLLTWESLSVRLWEAGNTCQMKYYFMLFLFVFVLKDLDQATWLKGPLVWSTVAVFTFNNIPP